ncbi:MAG TPA: phosphate uptake regulator PhoU [Nitrosopumilaceae archaeon]|nr:phosphate uptake regulator PhoU [Nitrosopumilaceae archaeon]
MPKFIRRLQKIGSSILVSLPKEWVDANNLEKSSEIEIETSQNSLSITANKDSRPSREVVISYPLPKDENIVADITGAYLLGYDIIKIKGKTSIPVEDREKIRESMRRLVGVEIVEEEASSIIIQFLLDAATLNPEKILKRMSTIAIGMFNETLDGLVTDDKTNLQTMSNRDIEINRQYFLLVRLIRSTMVDQRLASLFNMENIDILDYRIAANLLEMAGDTIVELANAISKTTVSKSELKKIHDIVKDAEKIYKESIDAFTTNDRLVAIDAIKLYREYLYKITKLRSSLEHKKQIPIDFLDIVYKFESIAKSWADIVDLIKPIYKSS